MQHLRVHPALHTVRLINVFDARAARKLHINDLIGRRRHVNAGADVRHQEK